MTVSRGFEELQEAKGQKALQDAIEGIEREARKKAATDSFFAFLDGRRDKKKGDDASLTDQFVAAAELGALAGTASEGKRIREKEAHQRQQRRLHGPNWAEKAKSKADIKFKEAFGFTRDELRAALRKAFNL